MCFQQYFIVIIFYFQVEGGLVDQAHHRGHARKALEEVISFSDAIQKTLELINFNDTLVIITSDHSHSLLLTGYPDRGQGVLCKNNLLFI